MSADTYNTREEWLIAASEQLTPLFGKVPLLRLSVGFPKGSRGRGKSIGQCWPTGSAADGRNHIFISPELSDPVKVLGTLVHEMTHAVAGTDCGHRGMFVTLAKAVGLTKPWTATGETEELTARLNKLSEELGPYPHGALSDKPKIRKGSRLRLWQCACGVKARVASDAFNAVCGDCGESFSRKG